MGRSKQQNRRDTTATGRFHNETDLIFPISHRIGETQVRRLLHQSPTTHDVQEQLCSYVSRNPGGKVPAANHNGIEYSRVSRDMTIKSDLARVYQIDQQPLETRGDRLEHS